MASSGRFLSLFLPFYVFIPNPESLFIGWSKEYIYGADVYDASQMNTDSNSGNLSIELRFEITVFVD